jgi:parallel beta-helix repeat protein
MIKRPEMFKLGMLSLVLIVSGLFIFVHSQTFQHPGINQKANDLALMKSLVLSGKQPYKDAFTRLKAETDAAYTPKAHTRVMRGPYGKPNIGGEDLRISANMAYSNALLWYITGEKKYADKSIEIINTWTPVVWDFDFNDAKLIAALTGSVWCNAAEILKQTPSGWKEADVAAFRKMLMTVYYPLLRFYFPTANGNWNGGIIQTILAISIFMDDRNMFNNAIDNFLHSSANGSIFKYIYPNGQCQESPRDQGHVQMGLGLFAGAAQIAFTQGVDLFTIGENRIAKGFEFTGSFMLGKEPHCYCVVSPAKRESLRDDYEYVYQHYKSIGIAVPWTQKVADSIRPLYARAVLTSVRAATTLQKSTPATAVNNKQYGLVKISGAGTISTEAIPENAIMVKPGESIQVALQAAGNLKHTILLKAGVHKISETLKIPSNITLRGEGINTKLFLDPASGLRDAMVNADSDMHDVAIQDMVIEVSDRLEVPSDPNSHRSRGGGYNRGGILFHSMREGQMKNITLRNLTVRNATFNGVFISGADNVNIINCDLDENGGNAVPGQKLQHNLLLTHCKNIVVENSRLTTSPYGSGLSLDHCRFAKITNNEIARNGYYGVLIAESSNINLSGNLIEANDRSGLMMEYLFTGNDIIHAHDNRIQYNAGWGIESFATKDLQTTNNDIKGNGNHSEQLKVSTEKRILMQ